MVKGKLLVTNLFDTINDLNLRYCHWKSTDHLDASFSGDTDFDILVSKKDALDFEAVLIKFGFIRARTPELRTYPCVEDYVYYDSILDRWFHFHLHYLLPCGDRWVKSYHIPIEDYILEKRVFLSEYGIYNIDPLSEYLFFIIRMHMKWRLPLKKISFIKENEYLRKRICNVDEAEFHPLFTKELAPVFDMVHCGKMSVPLTSQYDLKKSLKKYRRFTEFNFFIRNVTRYCYRLHVEFNRRILGNFNSGRRQIIKGGYIVAFVGMDGSGKSSMLLESEKTFSKQLNVSKVFLGTGRSGSHFLRRCIFKLADALPLSKSNRIAPPDDGLTREPSIKKLMWIYLCLRDRNSELNKLKKGIANGTLVLVDRWPQDCMLNVADSMKLRDFINQSGLLGYVARKEEDFYNSLKEYSADLTIWFDIEPETSLKRKPGELELSEAVYYRECLDNLSQNYFNNTLKVDAEKSFDEVSNVVNKSVWDLLSGK